MLSFLHWKRSYYSLRLQFSLRYVPRELLFFDRFSVWGLCQWIWEGIFLDSSNILDTVPTTEANRVGDICALEPFPKLHQSPVTFEYVMQCIDKHANESTSHLMWSRGNYARISASTIAVDWIMEFDDRIINESFLYLLDILQTLIDICSSC